MATLERKPYVGPRAFKPGERGLFFGRSTESRDLASLVIAHPVVLVYAASGAGKSSLLNAGVVPLLIEHGCEVLGSARVGTKLPDPAKDGDVANIYAFNVISSLAATGPAPKEHQDIAGYLSERPHKTDEVGDPVLRVVILDQFEELFTFAPERWEERKALIQQLAVALDADPRLRIVLAMREEFLGALETYASLLPHGARTRFRLDPLGPDAAKQAIEGPLEGTDVKIEPMACEQLIAELRKVRILNSRDQTAEAEGPFIEPVQLQVVCTKLWDCLPDNVGVITPEHVKSFGDVNEALKLFYEDVLDVVVRQTSVARDRLREWVELHLITPGGTRGMVYRGPGETGAPPVTIPNAAVDLLEEKHLIRAEARAGGERWYELTHDRFIEPIQQANKAWHEQVSHRQRNRKVRLYAALAVVLLGVLVAWSSWKAASYARTDGVVDDLLAEYARDPGAARIRAPRALGNLAGYLWQKGQLERLTALLIRAEKVVPESYRVDPRVSFTTPEVLAESAWPLELQYNADLRIDAGRLRSEWRVVAMQLALQWGIPVPATLKVTSSAAVPESELRVIANQDHVQLDSPNVPGYVLVHEPPDDNPKLRAWFNLHREKWRLAPSLKYGGPWWLVPSWTQPLFEAADYPTSPREAMLALAVGNALVDQPHLALTPTNVSQMLSQTRSAGFRATVAEALAARGGMQGIVEDLQKLVELKEPIKGLEYVLDSLANYPRAQYSSSEAAKLVQADLSAAAPLGPPSLTGTRLITAKAQAQDPNAAAAWAPYEDTARLISSESPVRVTLGKDIQSNFLQGETGLRPEILSRLRDLRGEIFMQFGIELPGVKFTHAESNDPEKFPPLAFRIELLNKTPGSPDAAVVTAPSSDAAVKLLLADLQRKAVAVRTWWISTEYVNNELSQNEALRRWLLNRYSITDIKGLLRGVVAPAEAELEALARSDPNMASQQTKPGQSIRNFNWLLASLAFWSQADTTGDRTRLVESLKATQAARRAGPNGTPVPTPPAALLAGIRALEQQDFQDAERQFRVALTADRQRAIAAFPSAYAASPSATPAGELNALDKQCSPFAKPGELAKPRTVSTRQSFDAEDYLAQHQTLAMPERVRLEYCLLQHYAANKLTDHLLAGMRAFGAPTYRTALSADQEYALGYWTLDLSRDGITLPAGLEPASNWLASAFSHWTTTARDEATAATAYRELLARYGYQHPPEPIVQMLTSLADKRPHNFDIAYANGTWFASIAKSPDEAKASSDWFKKARERLHTLTLRPQDARRVTTWLDYSDAASLIEKAAHASSAERNDMAAEAAGQLLRLIERMRSDHTISNPNWPGARSYGSLLDAYQTRNEVEKAVSALTDLRDDGLADSPDVINSRIFLLLATGQTEEALRIAAKAKTLVGMHQGNALFVYATAELVTNQPDAEYAAREALAESFEYQDYVRLLLYGYLMRQEKTEQANVYLEKRWKDIDAKTWPTRLKNGDQNVWREMLIGYYLGRVRRDEVFAPLSSIAAFKAGNFDRIAVFGLTYDGMRCEAHFYDALLQQVSGPIATRRQRYAEALKRTVEYGRATMYEYLMASYLLRVESKAGGPQTAASN